MGERARAHALALRRAAVDDAAAIARVHVNTWRSAYRGQVPDALLDALDEDEGAARWGVWLASPAHGVQVAISGGQLIGFSHLGDSRDSDAPSGTGEVMAIYVAAEHWRTGVGSALLQASIELARLQDHTALTLWVLASNDRARRFYERFAFAHDGAEKIISRDGQPLREVRYRLGLRSGM